jgi:hypothetical protein
MSRQSPIGYFSEEVQTCSIASKWLPADFPFGPESDLLNYTPARSVFRADVPPKMRKARVVLALIWTVRA